MWGRFTPGCYRPLDLVRNVFSRWVVLLLDFPLDAPALTLLPVCSWQKKCTGTAGNRRNVVILFCKCLFPPFKGIVPLLFVFCRKLAVFVA